MNKLYLLLTIGILFALAIPVGIAATVSSSASVTNVAPSVGTVSTATVTPLTGTTVTAWCNASVTDNNGYQNVQQANATFWDVGSAATETSADNSTIHYTNGNCTLQGGSGTTVNANCSFSIQYFANASSVWTCKIYANDTAGAVSSASNTSIVVTALSALSVPSTASLGTIALNTEGSEVTHTVTNEGNRQIDVQLSGSDTLSNTANSFNCTIGNVSIGQLKYNVTQTGQDWTDNMTAITGSAVTRTETNLVSRTGASNTTKATYWKLKMPATGVGGSCTGIITMDAIAG